MDIRSSLAAQAYKALRPETQAKPSPDDPSRAVANAAKSFTATLAEGEATAKDALLGRADPHALVQALAETQLAVETAATIRDRVVEAYQEILRMQV